MVNWDYIADLVPVDTYIPLFLGLILMNYYLKYRIRDYAIFGAIFLSAFITALTTNIALEISHPLIFYQMSFGFATITYFFFSLHINGIRNKKYVTKRTPFEITYVLFILILISQWKLMPQTAEAKFFGLTLPRGSSSFYPDGAGIQLDDGTVLLSTAHGLLAYLYWALIGCYGVFTYATLDLEIENEVTKRVKLLWTIAFSISALWAVTLLPYLFISESMNILIALSYIIKFIIAVRYREALLLSHEQLTRTLEYYENGISLTNLQSNQVNGTIGEIEGVEENLRTKFARLPAGAIDDLLGKKADTPKAVLLLGNNRLLMSVSFGKEPEEIGLIGNLVTALVSFSDHTLSPERKSSSYRFQTDNSNIVISPLAGIFICYLYTGNTTSAEIRIKKFIMQQEENMEFWKKIGDESLSELVIHEEQTIKDIIDRGFNYQMKDEQNLV